MKPGIGAKFGRWYKNMVHYVSRPPPISVVYVKYTTIPVTAEKCNLTNFPKFFSGIICTSCWPKSQTASQRFKETRGCTCKNAVHVAKITVACRAHQIKGYGIIIRTRTIIKIYSTRPSLSLKKKELKGQVCFGFRISQEDGRHRWFSSDKNMTVNVLEEESLLPLPDLKVTKCANKTGKNLISNFHERFQTHRNWAPNVTK
jgi:hypothetical protein